MASKGSIYHSSFLFIQPGFRIFPNRDYWREHHIWLRPNRAYSAADCGPQVCTQNRSEPDFHLHVVNLNRNTCVSSLQWRHNGRDDVSNHRRLDCLPNRLFTRRSKKTSKLRVTGLCGGNSPLTGEFPAQRASNAQNVPIAWRHHAHVLWLYITYY